MEHLIQHFRKEEQPFIEQVVNWVREVEDRYAPKLTDFLDPRQRFIVNSIIGQYDTLQMASGDFLMQQKGKECSFTQLIMSL